MDSKKNNNSKEETFILPTTASPTLRRNISSSVSSTPHRLNYHHRVLLEDRKGFLDHFKPRPLFYSTVRVTLLQVTTQLSNYFTDQLEAEEANDEFVSQNLLSESQAHQLNVEWEEREWNQRWRIDFPWKVTIALSKFHAMTLIMRMYETLLCEKILKVDDFVLDRLTLDLFKYSFRRKIAMNHSQTQNSTSGPEVGTHLVTNTNTTQYNTSDRTHPTTGMERTNSIVLHTESFGEIIQTCIWANLIGFAADCTVQHGVLMYAYVKYWMRHHHYHHRKMVHPEDNHKHHRMSFREETCEFYHFKEVEEEEEAQHRVQEPHDSIDSISGGMLLSFLFKSAKLITSKAFSLLMASLGGAVGTVIYPGWGMILGSQLGDAMSSVLLES